MHGPRRRQLINGAFGMAALSALGSRPAEATLAAQGTPRRILHVMSFDSPWRWTDGQFAGFKEGLGQLPAEFRVFQMDVKHNSSPEAKARKGREALALIDAWQPHLLYVSDDDAVEFVVRPLLNQRLPCVFSGVNKEPAEHGLNTAINVTGALEREHFVESVRLLQNLVPGPLRLAALSDMGPQWPPIIERMRRTVSGLPGVSLTAVDRVRSFAEFKARLQSYPAVADAVVQLGIFALADTDGSNVPYQEVQKWACLNSRLPDISFWLDRVHHGVLASMAISEQEQGRTAGRLARAILVEGKFPSALPIRLAAKGRPAISLARAKQLGLGVRSSLLLSSEVVTHFPWEHEG